MRHLLKVLLKLLKNKSIIGGGGDVVLGIMGIG
jgi:hypothetical protein